MNAAIRHSMRVAALLVLGFCGACQETESTGRGESSVNGNFGEFYNSLLEEVSSKPASVRSAEPGLIRIDSPGDLAIYFFTTPDHAAHPSIIKRSVVERDGQVQISTEGWTGGSAARFEEWMRAFRNQDEQVREQFK